MNDHFETLGLPSDASLSEVKQAYRDLARVWHPDRFASDARLQDKASEQLKAINHAYDAIVAAGVSRPRPSTAPRAAPAGQSGHRPDPSDTEPTAETSAPPREQRGPVAVAPRPSTTLGPVPIAACFLGGIVLMAAGLHVGVLTSVRDSPVGRALGPSVSSPASGSAVTDAPFPASATASQLRTSRGQPTADARQARTAAEPPLAEDRSVTIYPPVTTWTEVTPAGPQGESPQQFFTIGSTRKLVRKIHGEPTAVNGDTWFYGTSSVSFGKDRVTGYFNAGNLSVALRASQGATASVFGLGSSKEDVLALQGTPTRVAGDTWFYGQSSVSFSEGTVAGYWNGAGNLRVPDRRR